MITDPVSIPYRFGDLVSHLRRKADLTQVRAAYKAGISSSSWIDIEGGTSNPLGTYLKARERMQAIAHALGITVDDLIKQL